MTSRLHEYKHSVHDVDTGIATNHQRTFPEVQQYCMHNITHSQSYKFEFPAKAKFPKHKSSEAEYLFSHVMSFRGGRGAPRGGGFRGGPRGGGESLRLYYCRLLIRLKVAAASTTPSMSLLHRTLVSVVSSCA